MRNTIAPDELVIPYDLAVKLRDAGIPQISLFAWVKVYGRNNARSDWTTRLAGKGCVKYYER